MMLLGNDLYYLYQSRRRKNFFPTFRLGFTLPWTDSYNKNKWNLFINNMKTMYFYAQMFNKARVAIISAGSVHTHKRRKRSLRQRAKTAYDEIKNAVARHVHTWRAILTVRLIALTMDYFVCKKLASDRFIAFFNCISLNVAVDQNWPLAISKRGIYGNMSVAAEYPICMYYCAKVSDS